MTIRFACECGQQLAVRDENAGKRVRCTACSSIVAVPNGMPAPRPAIEEPRPAPPSTIRFSCEECGKAIQTKSEFAGKKTKCPGCGTVLTIPSSSGVPAAAVQAEKPKPRRLRDEDEDEDRREENEDEDRPRRGKKKQAAGGGGKMWIVIAACVLLLAGGGVAAWMLFFKGGGASADFDLVPRDAAGFGTLKVADMLKSDIGKKSLDLARKMDSSGMLKEFEQKLGLTLEDVDRATAVLVDPKSQLAWIIVRTTKDIDQKKVLDALKNPAEQIHQGKKYYSNRAMDLSISFVDARTVLLSDGNGKGITHCLGLPKPKSGPLDESIAAASNSKYHMVIGVNGSIFSTLMQPGMMGQADVPAGPALAGVAMAPMQIGRPGGGRPGPGRPVGPGGGPDAMMQQLVMSLIPQSLYFTATFKDQVEYEVGAEFADQNRAKSAADALTNLLAIGRGLMGAAMMGKTKADFGGVDPAEAKAQAEKILDQLKPVQDGKMVKISVTMDSKEIMKNMDQALATLAGGGGGGGGDVGGDPVGRIRDAANMAAASNNFKQMVLALIKTADDANGQMPALAIYDAQGKPLLSWRVAILRNMEQNELYKKIHLTERWDSPHNRQFWNQMPKTFELPGHNAGPGNTFIQAFTGPGTVFPATRGLRYPASITDGTSQTIFIAESFAAVNWMSPDTTLDARMPKITLGKHYKKGSLVGMGDGVVGFLSPAVSEATLKNAINPSDNNLLGPDWKFVK